MNLAFSAGALVVVGFVAWWLGRRYERDQQLNPKTWTHQAASKAWRGKKYGT